MQVKGVLLAVVSIITLGAHAQKNFFHDAEKYFRSGMVVRAIDSYKKAYGHTRVATDPNNPKAEKFGTKSYIKYRLGDCYYRMREIAMAQQYYETAIKLRHDKYQPDVYLKLANVLVEQGQYDNAAQNFKRYGELTGDDIGKQGERNCQEAMAMIRDKTRYKVEEEAVLNSYHYDFSPFFLGRKYDELLFTSNRPSSWSEEEHPRTGGQTKDLWYTKRDPKGHWGQPVLLNEYINTEHDEGAGCVDARGKKLYFTRCEMPSKKDMGCDIFVAEKKGRTWGASHPLEIKLPDMDTNVVGHPALSPDGKTIYFASDMPGGLGGLDIWMIQEANTESGYTEPINLGPTVNSPGNDMFPYIRINGELYFASDGHGGLGGLDIFKCEKLGKDRWANPSNMGVPINTSADDYGIIFEGERERGMLTSNRKGSGKDDLYRFYLPPLIYSLECVVLNSKTKEPIPNAQIKLLGSNNTGYDLKTDDDGMVSFHKKLDGTRYILGGTNYYVEVGKPGEYLAGKQQFTTINVNQSTNFSYEFLLSPAGETIILPEVRYDFDQYDLQVNDEVNSKDSLNALYDIMMENPTIIVKLRSHTDCRGPEDYNRKLAYNRAKACVHYLVEERGVPADRIIPVGMGEDEPRERLDCESIANLPTEEEREAAHQLNRRTDFQIVSWDYVPNEP